MAAAERPSAAPALLLAALCVLGLTAVWALASHISPFRVRDAQLLHDFASIEGPRINAVARELLYLLNPAQFTIWATAVVLFALARERARLALAVALVMCLAPFSAELLKPLLAHPHLSYGEMRTIGAASWPSGHATAATALALSAVLVTPPRRRWLAAMLALAFMAVIGVALLIRAWHMPSDVLGGYLLGTLWASLALAAVRASERRWPARLRTARGEPRGARMRVPA
ncbi:MAG TPA: phosphatase PAP2 family protein [Solirubrobacteraceae bacterium]|nr:phosphatase PAP2 family protein [Solirubrobacteraceae bacterium]